VAHEAPEGLAGNREPCAAAIAAAVQRIHRPPFGSVRGISDPVATGLVAVIVAIATTAASVVAVHEAKDHEHRDKEQQGQSILTHRYSSPAKPMNASDRLPAMISVRPVPLAIAGMSDSSEVSRIEAISTRASVKPRPAPTANTMPCRKS